MAAIADQAPSTDGLTSYDRGHLTLYLRVLDAATAGADWAEVVGPILGIDAALDPERARLCYESHLARARWISGRGYLDLLRSDKS
jgi:hypothetical protein